MKQGTAESQWTLHEAEKRLEGEEEETFDRTGLYTGPIEPPNNYH